MADCSASSAGRTVTADVAHVKSVYQIGCGAGYSARDLLFLGEEQDLLFRKKSKQEDELAHWPQVTDLAASSEQMLRQIEESPGPAPQWPGDQAIFLKQCAVMTRRCGGALVPTGDPFPKTLCDHANRCQMAVDMSIGSMRIRVEPTLAVAWINHRSGLTCADLARFDISSIEKLPVSGRNLVCCLIDFAFNQEWLEYALRPGPPIADPTARPIIELRMLARTDPVTGAPRHFAERPSEVSPHFRVPPPRRILVPRPPIVQLPKVVPRVKPGERASRRKRHDPSSLSSYPEREVPTDEETPEETAERAEATRRMHTEYAESAAGQYMEGHYRARQRIKEAEARAKAATSSSSSAPKPRTPPKEVGSPLVGATASTSSTASPSKLADSPVLRTRQHKGSPAERSHMKSPAKSHASDE